MAYMAIQPGEPAPAVPLAYFDQQSEPWLPIICLAAWVSIAYAILVIGGECLFLLMYCWQFIQKVNTIQYSTTSNMLMSLPSAIVAVLLLVGGVLCLRLQRAGRSIVLWSSAIIAVSWIIAFVVTAAGYLLFNSYPRTLGISFGVFQSLSMFITMLYRLCVPVILFLFFWRREVRDVFATR